MGDTARVGLRPLNEIITPTSFNTVMEFLLKEANKEKVTKEERKKQKDKREKGRKNKGLRNKETI
jgi:hypothetical protein